MYVYLYIIDVDTCFWHRHVAKKLRRIDIPWVSHSVAAMAISWLRCVVVKWGVSSSRSWKCYVGIIMNCCRDWHSPANFLEGNGHAKIVPLLLGDHCYHNHVPVARTKAKRRSRKKVRRQTCWSDGQHQLKTPNSYSLDDGQFTGWLSIWG